MHNMEWEESIFIDKGIDMVSEKRGTFPCMQKKVELLASLPTMRNSKALNHGDVLCLPYVPAVVGK